MSGKKVEISEDDARELIHLVDIVLRHFPQDSPKLKDIQNRLIDHFHGREVTPELDDNWEPGGLSDES